MESEPQSAKHQCRYPHGEMDGDGQQGVTGKSRSRKSLYNHI